VTGNGLDGPVHLLGVERGELRGGGGPPKKKEGMRPDWSVEPTAPGGGTREAIMGG